MLNSVLFLVSQAIVNNTNRSPGARVRLGVITENQYLLTGITFMVGSEKVLSEMIDAISLLPEHWLRFPDCCDFLITDNRMKNALLLLPQEYYRAGSFSGRDVLPGSLLSELHLIARHESVQPRGYMRLGKSDFTTRERELLALFSEGMSIKNILNTGRFSAKEISHYKQIIKRKAHCQSDVELLSALALSRQIRHTAGEFKVPGNAFGYERFLHKEFIANNQKEIQAMKLNYLILTIMLVTAGATTVTVAAAEPQAGTVPVAEQSAAEPSLQQSSLMPSTLTQQANNTPPSAQGFTPEQEAQIGEIAKNYLLAHPGLLIEVSQKLEARQQAEQLTAMTQAVLRHQDALLDDKSTPSYGPADAKVAFIEFFDYQCSVCARQAPVIESLMKANPQVRYVFKEWPIFAQRWEPSLTAAKTGLQVWNLKGADAYLTYHNALFATGHDEGKLTNADISGATNSGGKLKGNNNGLLEALSRTDVLAQNLGLRGTPGMIVMPVNGASADNVTVIPGGASQSRLQAAIDKASSLNIAAKSFSPSK